jgi:hypothetical protein
VRVAFVLLLSRLFPRGEVIAPINLVPTDEPARVGAAAAPHSGLLRFSVNEENMMLKLMLILSSWGARASRAGGH